MPELPEVETTRRGVARALLVQRICELQVHDARLRWPVDPMMPAQVRGQQICAVGRRAKYLLLRLQRGLTLRLNAPRRFGSLHYTDEDPAAPRLLRALAPEPLEAAFDTAYLWQVTRRRRAAIKQVLLNGHLVTGVGNIYASEALFRARIRPRRSARGLTRRECARLVRSVRAALRAAIRDGGTTLRDYVNSDGDAGRFRQKLYVYERAGRPCRRCATPIRRIRRGQRGSYYCPRCQTSGP